MKYEFEIKAETQKFAIETVRLFIFLKKEGVDISIARQILRSGTSIGANVREAKASSTRKELTRFYEIALRSAHETDYWLDIIENGFDIELKFLEPLKTKINQIIKVLSSVIVKLKQPQAAALES